VRRRPLRSPRRGEIWFANLDPTVGHEQASTRPVLIISADGYDNIKTGLVVVIPMTRQSKAYKFHVDVGPADTQLADPSTIMCDQIRTISTDRLMGSAPKSTLAPECMEEVEQVLIALLDLPVQFDI